MNYHVNRDGQDLGIFHLEELRRRRAAGEFTGREMVWCEGMTDWQTMQLVLLQNKSVTPPPIPPYNPKSDRTPAWIIAGSVVVFIGVISLIGVRVAQVTNNAMAKRTLVPTGRTQNVGAAAAASTPVKVSAKSITADAVTAKEKQFRQRQYLEGYKERGDRNEKLDADCLALIEGWLDNNFRKRDKTNAPIAELADKLAGNPDCKDGIVLTVASVEAPELHEGQRRLERALSAFANSRHKAYPQFYATILLTKYMESNSARRPALDSKAVALFRQALIDGSIRPDDQSDMAELLLHGWASSFFKRNGGAVAAAAKEAGPSFDWLALVLDGEYEINEAWRARGSGYADSVSANGWHEFERHLKIARSDLMSAWKLRPDFPQAPARMMTVALGATDVGEMRLWFDRAVAAQIDYPQAWSSMRWGLRPRWYGDTQSMLDFGVTALKTHRFDTDVPRKFFDSLDDLAEEEKLRPGEYLFNRPNIWPHLQEMYDGYIATNKGTADEIGWRSTYVAVAYLAGKYNVARQQLEQLNWEPRRRNFDRWHRELSLLPEEVAARTDPALKKVDEAETLRRANDTDGALKLFAEMSAVSNADERSKKFIRDRVVTVAQEGSLRSLDFARFMPQEDSMLGWVKECGTFKVLPDGDLEVNANKFGHALFSRANVGWSFEVKGEFHVVKTSSGAFQAGLVFGLPQLDSNDWFAFRIKRNPTEGDVAALSDGWTANEIVQPVKLNAGTNTFTFHMTRWKVTATVNGQEVLHEVKLPTKSVAMPSQLYVGFGAYNDMNDTVIRYHDVQLKRLPRPAADAPKPKVSRRKTT
jgi:hypothetical protein